MTQKHTPGPWQIKSQHEPHLIIANVDGETVAGVTSYSFDFIASLEDEYGEMTSGANARLVLAAPELLEAAQRTLNSIANTEGELAMTLESGDMLRAAIAKATGR